MNDNNVIKCRFCNSEFNIDDYGLDIEDYCFCPECGNPMLNHCINSDCILNDCPQDPDFVATIPFDFKYCSRCGQKSELYDFLVSQKN